MLKLSPLFFFLLIFSCAKDHEVLPVEEQMEMNQARHDDGKGNCNIPCRKPDFIHVTDIKSCSAVLDWGFNTKTCGTFVIQLQNLTTGNWTYFDPAVSPFTLANLDPCTRYTVGVSHVTNLCASVPLQLSFETDCRACKECDRPCTPPDFVNASDITTTGATINFGHNNPTCGYFVAQLKNNATGTYTYIDPAGSPLVLTGLDPCTSYTIGISHVTDLQACLPLRITFTTECEDYCDASGEDPSCLYIQYIHVDTDVFDDRIWSADDSEGYHDETDEIVHLSPGQVLPYTATGVCYCANLTGDLYIQLWIDVDNDGTFEAIELMYTFTFPLGGSGSSSLNCVDVATPGFTFPGIEGCGLRARMIMSIGDHGPCGDFPIGQVIDFTINSGECGS